MIKSEPVFTSNLCETCAHKKVCNRACYGYPTAIHYVHEDNFVEFPFAPGDTVYFVNNRKGFDYVATPTKVVKIGKKNTGKYFQMDVNSTYETSYSAIGKRVFLTIEEANAAAKELNENNPYKQYCFTIGEVR